MLACKKEDKIFLKKMRRKKTLVDELRILEKQQVFFIQFFTNERLRIEIVCIYLLLTVLQT